MKKLLSLFILLFASSTFGQKTVSELRPDHAAALQSYLSKNRNYQFISETALHAQDLKFMRGFLGAKAKPYYYVGDFNQDGLKDFALILGVRQRLTTTKSKLPLHVVIFNGLKNKKFEVAHRENVQAPPTCFLNFQDGKLYFAVSESDTDTMIFAPAGKGYIVEGETNYP